MATLTVTHSESLVLDGRNRSASKTFSITNIEEIYERTLTVPASAAGSETVLVAFDSSVEGAAVELPVANVKYIRITNTHASNNVAIGIIGAASSYTILLAAGQTHVLGAADDLLLAEASTNPTFGTLADLISIEAKSVSAATTVEVYIASTAG